MHILTEKDRSRVVDALLTAGPLLEGAVLLAALVLLLRAVLQ